MRATHFPEIFDLLLKDRNIAEEEKETFLNPDYTLLHDPLLLPDMEKARDRVVEAIHQGEHIVVYSDYDADGIPGAVVMSDFFRRAGYENVSFYIPHRHDEGFGLNTEAVKECAERVVKSRRKVGIPTEASGLMITVDCGIADVDEVALANSLGIDVIITDHHEPSERGLPPAYAVVDHKRKDSIYPFPYLCGSGMAYKLVQAILMKDRFGIKEGMEKWSLDMVGIATLSDMVPLVGENRILAKFGLEVLRKSPRVGLEKLFKKIGLDRRYLTEDDVGFMITPRINAASRMGIPEDAFKLLSTTDEVEAERLAEHLEKINQERKGVVASMVKHAKYELSQRELVREVIVIGNPDWKPSLVGLVANSLVEEYSRPVFVWGRDGDGTLKGSCRSFNNYDLHELMTTAGEHFLQYGGHAGAGGFSITLEKLTTLEEKLSEAIVNLSSRADEEKGSLAVSLSDISESLWQTVSQFAPFGMGNDKPVFKISNAPIRSVRAFGKEGNHLEVTLGNGVKAISFFSSPESYKLEAESSSCTLHAHLEKSYFRNRPEIRLRIVNIEL